MGVLEEIKSSVSRLESEVQGCRAELSQVWSDISKIDIQFQNCPRLTFNSKVQHCPRYISVSRFLKMASTSAAEAGRTQISGSPPALTMLFREQTPGKDQSWSMNLILFPMLRSVSPAAPRPNVRDFSPLNFTQVGMVAVSAIRLKRQTLPLGINEWSEDVVQEKLLEVVTRANVDVQVTLSKLLCPN